ncbi:MAG: gamma-glutamyl-gamma-aminobutyrate hydrolase family protein [Oscillospiraceae bacterium]|nr:gamma-glutamyl-gamma-aminobutyrate hydrolase family protein [Oscillospiraceae bacterium]
MQPKVYILGEEKYHNYCSALHQAGAEPVLSSDGAAAEPCHGLLLPGGGDIPGDLTPEEYRVIRLFVERGQPILGICRGMQALNVYFGGTLYQDIPGHREPDHDMVHPTAAEGPIAALFGPRPTVNSMHHQAVERLGEGLVICQWAEDGIAEALYHRTLPILGVQWHPERESFGNRRDDAVDAAPLFRRFISQVRESSCPASAD